MQATETTMLTTHIAEGYTAAVATVGENIQSVLDELGWTQVQLADRLEVRAPSVNKVIKAQAIPAGETLLKYATALRVSVDRLLVGVSPTYDLALIDRSCHSDPLDSALTESRASQSSLQMLAGPFTKAAQPNPPVDTDGVIGHGTDTGTDVARLLDALDARLSTLDALAARLTRTHDELATSLANVEALAEDFSEQAANLRTAPDPAQHAAAGALGSGVSEIPRQHLKQARRKGDRKTGRPKRPSDNEGDA